MSRLCIKMCPAGVLDPYRGRSYEARVKRCLEQHGELDAKRFVSGYEFQMLFYHSSRN